MSPFKFPFVFGALHRLRPAARSAMMLLLSLLYPTLPHPARSLWLILIKKRKTVNHLSPAPLLSDLPHRSSSPRASLPSDPRFRPAALLIIASHRIETHSCTRRKRNHSTQADKPRDFVDFAASACHEVSSMRAFGAAHLLMLLAIELAIELEDGRVLEVY